jgi:hypothetical protein
MMPYGPHPGITTKKTAFEEMGATIEHPGKAGTSLSNGYDFYNYGRTNRRYHAGMDGTEIGPHMRGLGQNKTQQGHVTSHELGTANSRV